VSGPTAPAEPPLERAPGSSPGAQEPDERNVGAAGAPSALIEPGPSEEVALAPAHLQHEDGSGARPRPAGQLPAGAGGPVGGGARRLFGRQAQWWPTLLTAGILCWLTFLAGGGLRLGPMTTVEIALTIGAAAVVACAVLLGARGRSGRAGPGSRYGLWSVGLLLAFSALTALSVVWSVQPDESWQDAGRMFAYGAFFGAAVVLVWLAPERWPAVLGGVTLAAVVVCGYALLTKVFPGQLDANDIYARLRAPYDYWNAIGLTAAMGVVGCMWLGARRAGHALLSALAYPATGLMLVTLLLAYSRGALVALALGLALWFCIVPLRLRGAAVLMSGALGAGVVVAWDFSKHALSSENVALSARTLAGHQLGVLLVAMLLALMLVGLATGFWTDVRAPSRTIRRRAGAIMLVALVLVPVALVGALSVSHRGLTGTISHDFNSLTNPNAKVPPNTPGRLTAIASVRARYWNEALEIFQAHPVLGAGAGAYRTARLRYRTETLEVKQAHGFIVQTLADLGVVGLLLALALLLTWMAAAGRSTHPFNRRWTSWRELRGESGRGSAGDGLLQAGGWREAWRRVGWRRAPAPYPPERIGLLSMLCLVVVFGVHSFADWTWYVPGDACVALLCAGWLAGRGPLERQGSVGGPSPADAAGRAGARVDPRSLGIACAVLVAALLAAWAQWQPLRSEDAAQEALALSSRSPSRALAKAHLAVARDPLSVQALFTLAKVQQDAGEGALAKATLQRAVRLQPSNPQTWLALGEYDLTVDPRAALNELHAAIYLNPEAIAPELIADGNPEAITIQNDYVEALRATTPPPATAPAPGAAGR
jgi:O-Antigen ligase